ncbi:hypothetical protein CUMW_266460 [Citrus unshiu]|uniref:Uncharacterized protein n=1 Tax=Citrus unshiu TaxID=55188 RepID=A0A2H5QWQ3_CITUN|nr:hypothetical protein CUMW_266460 [Citrus unshiu]
MERVKIPIWISRGSNDHPDEGWDPKAIPIIKGISFVNVVSVNTTKAPAFTVRFSLCPGPSYKTKAHLGVLFLEFSGSDLNFGVQMNCILGMETAFSKLRLQY